jgi:hypothetical protein
LLEALVGYVSTAEDEVSTNLRLPEDVEALRSDLYTRNNQKMTGLVAQSVM